MTVGHSNPNYELLAAMAKALGDLRERFVFVGGCATALLITDQAAAPFARRMMSMSLLQS